MGSAVSPPWGGWGRAHDPYQVYCRALASVINLRGYGTHQKSLRTFLWDFHKLELEGRSLSFRVTKLEGYKSGAISCHVPQCMEKACLQQEKRKPIHKPGRACLLFPYAESSPLSFIVRISLLRVLATQSVTKFTASLVPKYVHVTR